MEKEYEEKLKLCKQLLLDSQRVGPSEKAEKVFDEGYVLMNYLIQTKNTDVLCELFDLFGEELRDTGIGETLESEIFQNFTMEQIIGVLYKKFSSLIVNNETRAMHFAEAFLNTDNFDKFRDIFNSAKSSSSETFLNRFLKWYGEDYPEEIAILREDMKKWS